MDFVPSCFYTLGSCGLKAKGFFLDKCQRLSSHIQISEWEAHDWVFCRLSFAVMCGVAVELVSWQLADFNHG